MAPREFEGTIRETPAYKLGFKHRQEGKKPNLKRYKDFDKKQQYLVGFHSERHQIKK